MFVVILILRSTSCNCLQNWFAGSSPTSLVRISATCSAVLALASRTADIRRQRQSQVVRARCVPSASAVVAPGPGAALLYWWCTHTAARIHQ